LGAVIADIRSLEVAPRSALVARAVTLPQEEVAYVNFFFGFAADINAHFVLQSP
jgi:hypothetical protein